MNFYPGSGNGWMVSGFRHAAMALLAPFSDALSIIPPSSFAPFVPAISPTLPAPAINTQPIEERERDGFVFFRPKGAITPLGVVLHWHGFGGLGDDEFAYCADFTRNKGHEPIMAIAPLATNHAPHSMRYVDMPIGLMKLARTMPADTRAQLANNFGNGQSNVFNQVRQIAQSAIRPPSWYPFVFDEKGPDFKATVPLISRAVRHSLPAISEALKSEKTLTKRVAISAFSQGVGMASGFIEAIGGEQFCVAEFISASHIEEEGSTKTPRKVDVNVILPKDDPVMQIIGMSPERISADLRKGYAGATRIYDQVPGSHLMAGHAATMARIHIIHALSQKPVNPRPA